ncbi:MAG: hypothetical protein SGI77_04700 [Pirellulaceae bacterium]|nr:hypothetical protein [Pirellulaceae bacterium]
MDSQDQPNNPYANPFAAKDVVADYVPGPLPQQNGMISHVMVIGILQIVLGCLELFMGAVLIFYAVFFTAILPNMKNQSPPPPPEMMFWMSIGFGVGGVIVAIFSLLRILSGITSFRFRGRTLMITSLIGGMITSLTCYCAPFSIGLGVYGLIVMMHPGVIKAYEMGTSGMAASEIKTRFARAQFGL